MKRNLLVSLLSILVVLSMAVTVFAATIPEKAGVVRDDRYNADEAALIEKAIRAEYQAQLNSGFNPGKNDGYAHWWDGPCTQNFKEGDSTANEWGIPNLVIIFVNKPGDRAFTVKNDMIVAFAQAGATSVCGGPTTNEFVKDGKVVQNFEKGAFVDYEWLEGVSVEVPAANTSKVQIPEKVGVVRDDRYNADEAALIEKAIRAEYQAQMEAGFNPGKNDGYAHWWDGPCTQNFKEGDSTANEWGIPNLVIIFVNKPGDRAFTVKNDMIVAFAQAGATSVCGGPTTNEFVKDGKVVQNFEKGAFVDYEWLEGVAVEVPAVAEAEKQEPAKVEPAKEEPVKAAEPAKQEASKETKPAKNPKTSDFGVAAFIAAAAISGSVLVKRNRK